MSKIFIIGISHPCLSGHQERLLSSCKLIIGTKRFQHLVARMPVKFCTIAPLSDAFTEITNALAEGDVAILASGDPLFYGIGKKVLHEFPHEQVEIHPALSSLQQACALFKIPWDDAVITSLHGRKYDHIPGLLLKNEKNFIFTDSQNSPDVIAQKLLDYLKLIGEKSLSKTIQLHVAEGIGLKSERLFHGNLQTAAQNNFSSLNVTCLIVPRKKLPLPHSFGLTENEISHSRGLITKNEVRAVTLHALQLKTDGVFWDIGAGSGSLSIEAARLAPEMTVYAIEHKNEGIENIRANIVTFGCYNVIPVFGRAPESLTALPAPDRVFIGGSGGYLPEIVRHAARQLKSDGRLVINGVIAKTIENGPAIMRDNGFQVTTSTINVSRVDENEKKTSYNSITIMTGKR